MQTRVAATGEKVVVLDDDPTGTQSVHGVPVLTGWSVAQLAAELTDAAPAVYLLTNSRSLSPAAAERLNREIGRNLAQAARETGRTYVVVSRSDSTLRGHFPGEVAALAEGLGRVFDATLLIPAFIAGGRYTIGDVHYVAEGERLTPAALTEFARDAAFGYRSSNLREWVAEKTGGLIDHRRIASVSIEMIRRGGPSEVAALLSRLRGGEVCVINAASERDLAVVTLAALEAEAAGRRLLYRTAASFVPLRAGVDPRPPLTPDELSLTGGGGLIVVGSYVPKTSAQLVEMLARGVAIGVEVDAEALLAEGRRQIEIERVAREANARLSEGETTAIYTSRRLLGDDSPSSNLRTGKSISSGLVEIVRAIAVRPRFILAKGGITSSDVAARGLGVRRATVLGQVIPGVPVWRLGAESSFPGLSYVVFPGNVGEWDALADAVTKLGARSKN